jgi:hypothetical protein
MARLRRIETAEGVARLQRITTDETLPGFGAGDTFVVYRGGWGDEQVGKVTVDDLGTDSEVWTWWDGERGSVGGTASTETEAVAALLRSCSS